MTVAWLMVITSLVAAASAQFATTASSPISGNGVNAALGDFNRDGKLDFAVAANSLLIFLGNGDGTFHSANAHPVGTAPISVVAADLNHDGKLDLAVADLDGLYVLLGNGDGTFQDPVLYTTSCIPVFVAAGDFNGDHKIDLLVTYSSGNCAYVSIFPGNGDGTFQPTPINTFPSYGVSAAGVGDFNNDGRLDLAIAEQFGTISQAEILLGKGDGTFSLGKTYHVDGSPTSVAVADFLGNGKLGFAVAALGCGTSEFLGNGDGTFKLASDSFTCGAEWVAAADFNGDGKPDLAVAHLRYPGASGVFVIMNNGDGTFQAPIDYVVGLTSEFVAAADFNGDHMIDLLVGDYGTNHEVTLLNTGVVSFSPTKPISFPFQFLGTSSAPQTVTLTNSGSTALSISSVQATSSFHQTNNCGKSVNPGAKCDIAITFKPAVTGKIDGTISIFDSASSKPQVIELAGGGTAANISPLSLTFPSQAVGTQSASQIITLKNGAPAPMKVTRMVIDGTDYKEFSETNNCPLSLNMGASCTIAVTFAPAWKGTRTAVLYIYDNAGSSPQVIPLAGTGE